MNIKQRIEHFENKLIDFIANLLHGALGVVIVVGAIYALTTIFKAAA